jgi:tRNA pseudouridine13 synthase
MEGIAPFSSGSAPEVRGRIRVQPEDFQVTEELGFVPDGVGEHVLLRVRKRAANTDWVARRIAAWAGVATAAVSYAGLKDRHAVTEQWLSVHLPGRTEPDWSRCRDPSFQVLEASRHSRKLRRGAHVANRFRIVIRELRGDAHAFERHWARIAARGVPNYFGEQRFGRGGGNLVRAQAMFESGRAIRNRHKRGLYLSAARAHLFNRVLSLRVADGTWEKALAGDAMMLQGSHSIFPLDAVDDEIRARTAMLAIHPTGPLWGAGETPVRARVRALEHQVAAEFALLCRGLEGAGLTQERRALRLKVLEPGLELLEDGVLVTCFRLPKGGYATSVLREMLVWQH